MSDSGGRFKFLKKFSSKVDKLFLGDMIQSNKSESKEVYKDYYFDSPSNSTNFHNPEGYDYDNQYYDNNINSMNESYLDDKYSNYIYNEEFNRNSNFKEDFRNNDDYFNNEYETYFKENSKNNSDNNSFIQYDSMNNNQNLNNNSSKDKRISSFNLKNFKNKLLNSNESSKKNFGLIAISLIILVLGSSIFYFGIYQPFQNELNTEKTAKLNELNTLYKGPLALHTHVFTLENQIQDSYNINEIKSINILRSATEDWRKYHISKINAFEDQYGRVMMS